MPTYEELLLRAGLVPEHVETQKSVIYILTPDLRIAYCNAYWDEFAKANAGASMQRSQVRGTSVSEVTPGFLKPFYEEAFGRVQKVHIQWEHDFESSSASVYRLFHMRVAALGDGYIMVENSLRVETPHTADRAAVLPDRHRYISPDGLVTMCMHCRRTKRAADFPERLTEMLAMVWDWVPTYIENPPRDISYSLCRMCYPLFF